MLLRSSSTPFMHAFLAASPPPSPSSLLLRRAFSDGHLPSLHPSSHSSGGSKNKSAGGGGLHTELSFSVYNTFDTKAPPPASQEPRRVEEEQDPKETARQEQPELPMFLARGLGIDRIASGLLTTSPRAAAAAAARAAEMGEKVVALDAQYKKMVDEQPGSALFLRNYAQFLHEVKGDPRRAEEYYSRAMLADPSDGEIMSQYAKLVWEVYRDHDRSLAYFQKSVQAAPQNSHVLAAYASFLWAQEEEDDDDNFGEGERGLGGELDHVEKQDQATQLASVAV